MLTPSQLAVTIRQIGEFDQFSEKQLFNVLESADNLYFNSEGSFLSDVEYDSIHRYCKTAFASNPYFYGIGSKVRGGKVKLPFEMGSLNQIEVGEIVEWVGSNSLQKCATILTDKLDGQSGLVIYGANGDFRIAYSRGNGVEGADISRHLKHIVSNHVECGEMVIRGELIISKENFIILQGLVKASNGEVYKNARNMISGLMNSKTVDPTVYKYIDFVVYDVLNVNMSKIGQLQFLNENGFETPYLIAADGQDLTDKTLAAYLEKRREESLYEIDGLVIDVDDRQTREKMDRVQTSSSLNPAHAIKYKVADATNIAQATVVDVEWNVSKHGYLKPRVQIEPVELVGVTVQYATGFNAKFIRDNKIGPGAIIEITRSGDVIPLILRTIQTMPIENM
jgi:NAD-dependent DNA ligase